MKHVSGIHGGGGLELVGAAGARTSIQPSNITVPVVAILPVVGVPH